MIGLKSKQHCYKVLNQFFYITDICKTEGGTNPNQDCIFPFIYAVPNPEDDTKIQVVTDFLGCVKTKDIGLWCPTKLVTLEKPGTGEIIENVYVEGLDIPDLDRGLCSPGCIKHGNE